MAINRYFIPAEAPKGQQFYKLPFNELAMALGARQGLQDKRVEDIYASEKDFGHIPFGMDQETADEWRGKFTTGMDELMNMGDLTKAGDKVRKFTTWAAREHAYGTPSKLTQRLKEYDELKTKIDTDYKENPLLSRYYKEDLKNRILEEGVYDEEGQVRSMPGLDTYRDVSPTETRQILSNIIAGISEDTLRQYDMTKEQLFDYVYLIQSGQADGYAWSKVAQAVGDQVPDDLKNSFFQTSRALRRSNFESERDPVLRDANGKVIGFNLETELGKALHGLVTGKTGSVDKMWHNVVDDKMGMIAFGKSQQPQVPISIRESETVPQFSEVDMFEDFETENGELLGKRPPRGSDDDVLAGEGIGGGPQKKRIEPTEQEKQEYREYMDGMKAKFGLVDVSDEYAMGVINGSINEQTGRIASLAIYPKGKEGDPVDKYMKTQGTYLVNHKGLITGKVSAFSSDGTRLSANTFSGLMDKLDKSTVEEIDKAMANGFMSITPFNPDISGAFTISVADKDKSYSINITPDTDQQAIFSNSNVLAKAMSNKNVMKKVLKSKQGEGVFVSRGTDMFGKETKDGFNIYHRVITEDPDTGEKLAKPKILFGAAQVEKGKEIGNALPISAVVNNDIAAFIKYMSSFEN